MVKLEDLTSRIPPVGLLPSVELMVATVVPIEWAVEDLCCTSNGITQERLLNRADEASSGVLKFERPLAVESVCVCVASQNDYKYTRIEMTFRFGPDDGGPRFNRRTARILT